MVLIQAIKEHTTWWSLIFGSTTTAVTLVGALFMVDGRYAHAEDVLHDKIDTQHMVKDSAMSLRKQMVEDKLFELDIRKSQSKNQKLTPIEEALRERYQRQLDEIIKNQRAS